MLGLPDFEVSAAGEYGGELEVVVQTIEGTAGCARCGVPAVAHGRRPHWVRDIPSAGRPVVIVWHKRIWRCDEPLCATRTWSEQHPAIRAKAALTERARKWACRRVGRDGETIDAIRRELGVGWSTVMRADIEYGRPLVEDPDRCDGVSGLGMDETALLAANATHHTSYVTGFVDLDSGRLLDVVEDRCAASVSGWLKSMHTDWRDRIEVLAIDPHAGYRAGLLTGFADRTERGLPAPRVVVDHFHAIKLANAAIDDVRRRVQQHTLGHRGRKGDPLYGIRRVLLRGAERLTDRAWQRLIDGLDAGDHDQQVARAWIGKEQLRKMYAATDADQARRRLSDFYTQVADAQVPELTRLATTISRWQNEVLTYFDTGRASNRRAEAANLLIKKIRRLGFGFRNFDNYRLRLLLHCGVTWQTPQTVRIRSRRPRMVA